MPKNGVSKGESLGSELGRSPAWAVDSGLATRVHTPSDGEVSYADPAPSPAKQDPYAHSAAAEARPGGRELTVDEPYMIGCSQPMRVAFDLIRRFAITNAPVLITGESGTGKELAALAIHERSEYRSGPFVAINCAGLPPTLMDSELFGYEKGAFTGATQRKIGRLEAANGGTVFLDEIGDLPLELQSHMLRFLQEGMIQRLGGHRSIPVSARIIAATNKELSTEIGAARFREDLFYRLNTLMLELPPLRDRGDDIYLIATFFLKKFATEMNRPVDGFADSAVQAMQEHDWPGNVRELISRVRRAVVMVDEGRITASDLDLSAIGGARGRSTAALSGPGVAPTAAAPQSGFSVAFGEDLPTLETARNTVEKALVQRALLHYSGNISKASGGLGVSRVTLYRLIEKYQLQTD